MSGGAPRPLALRPILSALRYQCATQTARRRPAPPRRPAGARRGAELHRGADRLRVAQLRQGQGPRPLRRAARLRRGEARRHESKLRLEEPAQEAGALRGTFSPPH